MAEWSYFPNAVHIDRILAHLREHPEKWSTASNAAGNAAWNAAGYAARDAAWNAAGYAARHAAWYAARGAILALIAYDDCTYLLNMTPEQLEIYAHLGARGAWLLLPAVIAMNENENE